VRSRSFDVLKDRERARAGMNLDAVRIFLLVFSPCLKACAWLFINGKVE